MNQSYMRPSFIQLFNLNDKRRVLEFKYILINSLSMHETLIKKAFEKEKKCETREFITPHPCAAFLYICFSLLCHFLNTFSSVKNK